VRSRSFRLPNPPAVALLVLGLAMGPLMILAARRSIPKLYTVTDASAAAGMPDGEYALGDRKVFKRGLRVTLEDNVGS